MSDDPFDALPEIDGTEDPDALLFPLTDTVDRLKRALTLAMEQRDEAINEALGDWDPMLPVVIDTYNDALRRVLEGGER